MPKKNQNINIVIENNLFSKNKETDKKEDVYKNKPTPDNSHKNNTSSLSYTAPFVPEPSFMKDIRQAYMGKNMYGLNNNITPPAPMYNPSGQPIFNHYYNSAGPSNLQGEEEPDEEPDEEPEEEDPIIEDPIINDPNAAAASGATTVPQYVYDAYGKYVGPNDPISMKKHENKYNKLLKFIMNNGKDSRGKKISKPQRKTIERYSLQQYFPDLYPNY